MSVNKCQPLSVYARSVAGPTPKRQYFDATAHPNQLLYNAIGDSIIEAMEALVPRVAVEPPE